VLIMECISKFLSIGTAQLGKFCRKKSINWHSETVVPQTNWNIDKLDGTGISGITLDISKAQILWMDIEWLGLGTVRIGFVINGNLFTVIHSITQT
jgi:hypothetical protein